MTLITKAEAGEVRVALPFPPSVNALYRAVGGRSIISERYRRWKAEAGVALMAQRPRKLSGPVSVSVALCPKDNRRRDIDNSGFKAVLDLLVSLGVIEGDDSRFVRRIEAEWVESDEPCTVTVRAI